MGVCNVHERVLPVPDAEAGLLIDGLSGAGDRLRPGRDRPPMVFDGPLAAGAAAGGHGPVRHTRRVPGGQPGPR